MLIKAGEICKIVYLLYFSIVLQIDEASYDIVWYGPLMMDVFTLFPIYTCVYYGLEEILL